MIHDVTNSTPQLLINEPHKNWDVWQTVWSHDSIAYCF
jgi:hypothetical protein